MDELESFRTTKPDVAQLREQYPELSDLLNGEFLDKPNVYELPQGVVVSWTLNRSTTGKNPTYGRIPNGHFEFPTDHTEEVTVLRGALEAEVEERKGTFNRGQTVIAPPNSLLKLDVRGAPVYYFCQYKQ